MLIQALGVAIRLILWVYVISFFLSFTSFSVLLIREMIRRIKNRYKSSR